MCNIRQAGGQASRVDLLASIMAKPIGIGRPIDRPIGRPIG